MLLNNILKLSIFISCLSLVNCVKETKDFELTIYLSSTNSFDLQVFYNSNYLDLYEESRSKSSFVPEEKDFESKVVFKLTHKPQRLRFDFNTNQEIQVIVDSIKILYNSKKYLLKEQEMKQIFMPNPQVKMQFLNNKMILETFKTNEMDPYIITKNLHKYLK